VEANNQQRQVEGARLLGPEQYQIKSYGDAIELGLSRGRNAMAIWHDLVGSRAPQV
jgi:hypothetical protein